MVGPGVGGIIMKKLIFGLVCLSFVSLCSCSDIPNKSIFEELSSKELSQAIKSEPSFGEFYVGLQILVKLSALNPDFKSKYNALTYKRLVAYKQLLTDTVISNNMTESEKDEYYHQKDPLCNEFVNELLTFQRELNDLKRSLNSFSFN